MLKQVGLEDIQAIAIGAGILGTGGGGSPYQGSLHLRSVIRELGPQRVMSPDELADNAVVAVAGFIGAPTASIEKIHEGTELLRAMGLLEEHLGKKLAAVGIAEIGGSNAMGPLVAGLQAGIPTLDGDGMGRAFPELQMASFLFNGGAKVAPFAMVDAGENSVIFPYTKDAIWAERLARVQATSMGATAGLVGMVMTGKQFRTSCVPYTLTLAQALGTKVLESQRAGIDDIPQVIADMLLGKVLFRGKLTDVHRRITKGFARGTLNMESFGSKLERLFIEFQNEFLIASINDEVVATVPDLICIVDLESGEPISTELLRYGMRVAVLAAPAPAALKTDSALKFVGPHAFGYNVAFKPMAGERIGVPLRRETR
jgi:DUF917 family protein